MVSLFRLHEADFRYTTILDRFVPECIVFEHFLTRAKPILGTQRRLIQVDSGANVHGSNDAELDKIEPFRHDVHGVDQRAIKVEERGQLHFTINAKDRETGSPLLIEISVGNVLKMPSMTNGHTLLSADELAQKGIGFSVLPATEHKPVRARLQTIAWTSDMLVRNGAFYIDLADE